MPSEEKDWNSYAISTKYRKLTWGMEKYFSWKYVLGVNQIDANTVPKTDCSRWCLEPASVREQNQYYRVNDTHICGLQPSIHSSNCIAFTPIGKYFGILIKVDGGTNNAQRREMIIPNCPFDYANVPMTLDPSKMQSNLVKEISGNNGIQQYEVDFLFTFWLLVITFLFFVSRYFNPALIFPMLAK
ncbi:hypothetical protein BJV82DRAFT_579550 [Fennellomyces sp. T-0311]|nr:hypothetical protein BJV82DRAFT_579550 [Fennellomyces sp. T-0311]